MASNEEDRINILEMVKEGPGFRSLNLRVNDLLRSWVIDAVLGTVKRLEKVRLEAKKKPAALNRGIRDDASKATNSESTSVSETEFADSMSNLGLLLERNGGSAQALECHKKAEVSTNLLVLGSALPKLTQILGVFFRGWALLTVLLHGTEEHLQLELPRLGKSTIITIASSLYSIASVLFEQGNYLDALAHGQKAPAVQETAAFLIHRPDTGASYNLLGMIHLQRGDYNGALQYARRGLGIRESTFGIYHPNTASSSHALGLILRRMGGDGLAFALAHFQNALAIR